MGQLFFAAICSLHRALLMPENLYPGMEMSGVLKMSKHFHEAEFITIQVILRFAIVGFSFQEQLSSLSDSSPLLTAFL